MLYSGYIYIIRNKVNDKVYIGQTMQKPGKRFKQHLQSSESCIKLNNAIKKYGKENFYEDPKKLFVICSSSLANIVEKLNYYETYYIKLYNSVKNGYNCNYGGDHPLRDDSELKYGTRDPKLYSKAFREEHREELKLKDKEYYLANREKISIKAKEKWINRNEEEKAKHKNQKHNYYIDHKEEINARNKTNYHNNKERYQETSHQYYIDHKEQILERTKTYAASHKKERAQYDKEYREKNKEKIAERKRNWYKANKERIKAQKQEKRAIKTGGEKDIQ